MKSENPYRNQQGVALVVVIFVIVILSILAINLSYSTRIGLLSVRNLKEGRTIEYAMLGAFNEAVQYIAEDRDPVVDYIDDRGVLHLDDREPFQTERTYHGINLHVQITDEESRFNINMINDNYLRRLLRYADVPDDKVQVIMDSLRDWIDPDDLHRPSGAEKEYYEGLKVPYRPKNAPLSVPEELLLLREFKKEYLYGSEDRKGIINLITTHGGGKININTAGRELMEIMGLTNVDIETILSQRNSLRGYRAIPPHLTGLFQAISSMTFRIEVEAGERSLTAIVQRIPAKKGYTLKTLYWRER